MTADLSIRYLAADYTSKSYTSLADNCIIKVEDNASW